MDHLFLKEAGSSLKTGFHQDAPYFPFDSSVKAAVCWVPVDAVTKESGGMRYIKGSHKWPEYSPPQLITTESVDGSHGVEPLPDIEAGIKSGEYEVLEFDNVQPGDVIIHCPNTVHGSSGNTSSSQRRMAASIRYVGSDVRWQNKSTLPRPERLAEVWASQRPVSLLQIPPFIMRRALRLVGLMSDDDYYTWCNAFVYLEMRDGDRFDARDCARVAFPVVWSAPQSKL